MDVAERLASEEGYSDRIRYFACDLNTGALESNKYDICFSGAAMHHVENLERALAEVSRALRPDGLFVLLEYVGPARFQWNDVVQLLMNRLLSILPQSYRTSIREPGVIKHIVRRPSIKQVVAADPSEAVRSDEILGQLEQSFDILYRVDLGGTLLQFLLADIVGHFKADDANDRALLELIILFEETLVEAKIIPSDFVMVVVRPRVL